MPAISPPRSRSSLRDRSQGSPHLRVSSRSGASSPLRVPQLDRLHNGSYSAHAPRSGIPGPGSLHFTNLISPSGFAQPSYAVSAGTGNGGGGNTNSDSSIDNFGQSYSLSRASRRNESVASRSGRHDRAHPSSPPKRRGVHSPMPRSTASAVDGREMKLLTPPTPHLRRSTLATGTTGHQSSPRGRSRQQQAEDKARRSVSPRSNTLDAAAAAGGGGGAMTRRDSSPLFSNFASCTSMNSNDGGGTAGPPATFPARSTALNPLRPTAVTIELPADASVSVNGGGISTTPSTSLANLPATGSSKEHCSFCKAVDTALYLCPCGLARYCSTVCQHAHWSLHRTVCGNSVHAVEPSWRRCDWCGRASQTLRRCACGVVYYCDVDCQRADWPYHRLVCSTVGSAAVVAALLGGPAPRTTREAATQTAHWQINVPVRRSIARSDVALDSRGVSGYASTSVPPSQQYAFAESESFAETRFLEGSSSESEPSFPRSNRTQPPPWAHGSPAPGDSALTDASLLSSNSTSATAAGRTGVAGHMDPARRLSPSRVGNVLRPHTSSGRRTPNPHPRPQSFYESLCLTASQQGSSSPSTAHFRSYTDASSTISKGTGHSSVGFTKSTTMSSGIIGAGSRYPYAVSEAEGAGNSSNVSPAISMSPVRDQPSLLAFAATSQRKIESDEQKEWAELCRQFHVDRISIELMVLPKLEEEQRMTILKEEVMWCIVTGYPAAKSLKQRVLRRDK